LARTCLFSLITLTSAAYAQENASTPLAAVNSIDVRYQQFDLRRDAVKQAGFRDGSYMLQPHLTINSALHTNSKYATAPKEETVDKDNAKKNNFA